jgi:hypothetical protein
MIERRLGHTNLGITSIYLRAPACHAGVSAAARTGRNGAIEHFNDTFDKALRRARSPAPDCRPGPLSPPHGHAALTPAGELADMRSRGPSS